MSNNPYSNPLIEILVVVCTFLAAFGVWKVVEIIIWLCRHVKVTIQ